MNIIKILIFLTPIILLIPGVLIIYKNYKYKKEKEEKEDKEIEEKIENFSGDITKDIKELANKIKNTTKVVDTLQKKIAGFSKVVPEVIKKVEKIAEEGTSFFEKLPELIFDEIKKLLKSVSKEMIDIFTKILPELFKVIFNVIFKLMKEVYGLAVKIDSRIQYIFYGIILFFLLPLFPAISMLLSILSMFIPKYLLIPLILSSGAGVYYYFWYIVQSIFSLTIDIFLNINWTKIISKSGKIITDASLDFINKLVELFSG